jgi:hypothetical protein
MRVVNKAELSADRLAGVERELCGQRNLGDVMKWALAQPPGVFAPTVIAGVVVQDEFTHDVIVPWRDGLVLVYDTT